MNRNLTITIAAIVLLLAIAAGGYAYWLVGRPVAAPSQPTAMEQNTPTESTDTMQVTDAIPVQAMEGETVFHLSSQESTATFTLNEVLYGEPKTVIGTTNNVSGELALNRTALDQAHLGTIRVNARTFVTDSEQRNRAIVRMVLRSETAANEFIEFTPTKISGFPASVENGTAFPFTVEGDLTISGTTKPATFEGTASFESDDRLTGSVKTMIRYPDWGVNVPQLPFLANVDQDVQLTFDFVATP